MDTATSTTPCRACSAPLTVGARKCDRCGVLQRDDVRCPHCGAVADAAPDAELLFACEACGGPRVPHDDAVAESDSAEVAALRKVESARRARAGWKAAGFGAAALLAFGLGMLGLAGLAFGAGLKLAVVTVLFGAPLAALLGMALRRISARSSEIRPALDAAWQAAASDVARRAQGALSAGELARALRIDEPRAEELLAQLDVNDMVSGADTDALRSTPPPRMRVDVPPEGPAEAEVEAEREAEADAAALPEAAQARAEKGES